MPPNVAGGGSACIIKGERKRDIARSVMTGLHSVIRTNAGIAVIRTGTGIARHGALSWQGFPVKLGQDRVRWSTAAG